MNWGSWQAFVHMGGHGVFVWGSVGMVAMALAVEWLTLWWQGQQVRRDLSLWRSLPGAQATWVAAKSDQEHA